MLINGAFPEAHPQLQTMRKFYRMDENAVLEGLLDRARMDSQSCASIKDCARELVIGIRQAQHGKGGVDALLNEFSLSTEEGIVLMCLAEALLRVPDQHTCDALIRDKLTQGDWSSHLGNSDSLFVNASAWGLLLAGTVVSYNTAEQRQQQVGLLKRTVNRLGEPVIRAAVRYAMKVMGTQFVMGTDIHRALQRAVDMEQKGYRYSYDMLGEGARTMAAADRYFESYVQAIEAIGVAAAGRGPQDSPGISVKLSAIHPRYELFQRQRVMDELVPRLKALALRAKQYDIGLTVDAEEADRLELSLEVIGAVFEDGELEGWQGFGLAVQAYQKRAPQVIEWAKSLSQQAGRKMMVRLVKGAYWDSEIKWTQEQGLDDYPVFTRKPSTDVSYHACAKQLLGYRDFLYPQFASHNAYTVAVILEMDDGASYPRRQGYEFQRLHGMGEVLFDQVLEQQKVPCRIYAPVGEHADLLAYLVRRLLENGANSSFVNNIVDESVPVDSLLEDPVALVSQWADKRNPHIPLPKDLLKVSQLEAGERQNSIGLELTDVAVQEELQASLESWWNTYQLAIETQPDKEGDTDAITDNTVVSNPACLSEPVGRLSYASRPQMLEALATAHSAFSDWSGSDVQWRADCLRRLGDRLEQQMPELMGLCTKEAGKTLADGVAEVREAVDFCRYYADRAEELMDKSPFTARGVFLCISPWNFPLAIFLGQVTAALVTGNTVVAKPAEQTSLVAIRLVALMREVGIPQEVVQLVVAPGKLVGETLVPDPRVQGVMFTGSTDTGRWLARALAQRSDGDIPLIAETGGQNAMVVDSTALPEQVVDDVIQSGFQSAGQRCSALRVLFLQEDIADKVIEMIRGAMEELSIGDPGLLSTDVGPVIDIQAYSRLVDHANQLNREEPRAKLLHQCTLPEWCMGGNFFVPHLYEIEDLSVLQREVFGPVVHVVRFKAEALDKVIDQINATGFGLTLGVHSRIEAVAQEIADRANVGNVYINRNMIGAVVGVQPFGGRGLSGTGPKAGGPHYLNRLVRFAESSDAQVSVSAMAGRKNDARTARLFDWLVTQHQAVIDEDLKEEALAYLSENTAAAQRYVNKNQLLPGPTGEENCLISLPKGQCAVITSDSDDITVSLRQVHLALLAGTSVQWLVAAKYIPLARSAAQKLKARGLEVMLKVTELSCLDETLQSDGLEAVLVHKENGMSDAIRKQLADRQGALLSLVLGSNPHEVMPRLLHEKTVTKDTTAAGGNASLMTLGGDSQSAVASVSAA